MKYRKNTGFTLLELMFTIGLLGVILAIAVPSLVSFVKKNNIRADVQNIQSLFLFAKGHSVSDLSRVRLCWNDTDVDRIQSGNVIEPQHLIAYDLDDSDVLLRKIKYVGDNLVSTDDVGNNCFRFDPQGRPNRTALIAICQGASDNENSRAIELNRQGRVIIRDNAAGEARQC